MRTACDALTAHNVLFAHFSVVCKSESPTPPNDCSTASTKQERERECVLSVRYVLADCLPFAFVRMRRVAHAKRASGHTLALSLAAVEETTDYSALSLWGQRSVAIVMPTLTARRGRCRGTRRVVLLCCVLCLKETENVFFVRSRKSLS